MTSVTGAPQTPRGGAGVMGFRSRAELLTVTAVVTSLMIFGYIDLRDHFDTPDVLWRPGAEGAFASFFAFVRALPILWCRTRPLTAFTVVVAASSLAGLALAAVVGGPVNDYALWPWSLSSQLCIQTALVIAGLQTGRRRTFELAAAYVLTTLLLLAVRPGADFVPTIGVAVGESALVVGCLEFVRDRRDTRQALVAQEEQTEAERTGRTLLEERARIGRELHDVVAHHMSLIAVQAETAPFRIPGQSSDVEAEFRSISAASREALTDMRKILGLLRGDSAEAETAPQPRLADVPALTEEAGAGLEASGDLENVPPLIGVTAYRVVQESLSNARRHALGADVSVRIARTVDAVRIEVYNAPPTADTERSPGPGDGQGITGMRERVALVHGEIEAGPTPDGGFAVVATLPLRGEG